MKLLPLSDIPGNTHVTDPDSPSRVTSAASYRNTWTHIVAPGDPRRDGLLGSFKPEYVPFGDVGIIGLESQEHSLAWVGPAVIAEQAAAGHPPGWSTLVTDGFFYGGWPNTGAWENLVPAVSWHPGGCGVLGAYPLDGGEVVVYEIPGRTEDGDKTIVTWHCTACHVAGDWKERYESREPRDRQIAARQARRHSLPGQCEAAAENPKNDAMVAVVARTAGKPASEMTYASWCAAREIPVNPYGEESSCAEVRQARTRTAAAGETG